MRQRVELTAAERAELEALVAHHPKPYVRERAGAILKIANGAVAAEVARTGLLQPRDTDTVYAWLHRFAAEGVAGLQIRPGRGRKPAFPPPLTEHTAADALRDVIGREPRQFGLDQTRWTLAGLGQVVPWLMGRHRSGIWRLLRRLGLRYKRGREHIHSPDPAYVAKQQAVTDALTAAHERRVLLFLDEFTGYRQPTVARAWATRGRDAPRAERSHRANTTTRLVATLDARSGRVLARRRSHITIATLVGFLQEVRAAYPEAEQITLVLDNWPVHFHPDVLVALEPQTSPWPWPRPANWPTQPSAAAQHQWGRLQLPIQLLPLPTYASWLNPIEKLWRWLKAEVLHLHPWADNLEQLRAGIDRFLARFAQGSDDLLRYVGLPLPDYIIKLH